MKTAFIIIILAMLTGFGLFVSGIYVLFGAGWALLAGAFSMFMNAYLLRAGVTSG